MSAVTHGPPTRESVRHAPRAFLLLIMEKVCKKCFQTKPMAEFRKTKKSYRSACKVCERAVSAAYQKNNFASIKKRMDAWREQNKEALIEKRINRRLETNAAGRASYHASLVESRKKARIRARRYLEKNRDILRVKNKERMRLAYRKKYDDDPAYFLEAGTRRRAEQKSKIPGWANISMIRAIYRKARMLRDAGIECHVDHIVPLRSPLVCGLHVQNNLVIVDPFTNRSKGNRHWPDMP